jgi:ankyrin repeat protein
MFSRLYSNVGKLSSVLSDLNSINLKYYLNTPDENECLPLYYAIKADCLNTVKFLLDTGASISRTTAIGDPAAHLACLLGVSITLIDFLLTYGGGQNFLYNNDQEGWTVLHCAANQGHLDIVKYLITEKHMNPNVRDGKNRYSSLQLAVVNSRMNVVEYFLSFETISSLTNKHKPPNGPNEENNEETNLNNSKLDESQLIQNEETVNNNVWVKKIENCYYHV